MKKKPAKKAAKKAVKKPLSKVVDEAINRTIKKAKGKVKSSISGQFVKPEYAKKHKATTFTTKPSKNDRIVKEIKKIFKDGCMDFVKLEKIKELVYKK